MKQPFYDTFVNQGLRITTKSYLKINTPVGEFIHNQQFWFIIILIQGMLNKPFSLSIFTKVTGVCYKKWKSFCGLE